MTQKKYNTSSMHDMLFTYEGYYTYQELENYIAVDVLLQIQNKNTFVLTLV